MNSKLAAQGERVCAAAPNPSTHLVEVDDGAVILVLVVVEVTHANLQAGRRQAGTIPMQSNYFCWWQ
jgi:hypothetical protein